MELNTLMQVAGLTDAEQLEVQQYLKETDQESMMLYVAENLQPVTHEEQQQFECINSEIFQMTEEEIDKETHELEQLLQTSILNRRQVELMTYVEQIIDNMRELKPLQLKLLNDTEAARESNQFNDELEQYVQMHNNVLDAIDNFIKEFNAKKQYLNVFQPNLQTVLNEQLQHYKSIIKEHEQYLSDDLQKNQNIMEEAKRVSLQIQQLQIKNMYLDQLIQMESHIKYNRLDEQTLDISETNIQNQIEIVKELQKENIQLTAQYIDSIQNTVDEQCFKVQQQVQQQLLDDLDIHLRLFRVIYDFIQEGYNKMNEFINSNNDIINIISDVVEISKINLEQLTDQQKILQEVIMQVLKNQEMVGNAKKPPLISMGIDKVLEGLLGENVDTVTEANDKLGAVLGRQYVNENHFQSENTVKSLMFRKQQILKSLMSIQESQARLRNYVTEVDALLGASRAQAPAE